MAAHSPVQLSEPEPPWPAESGPYVVLVDASSTIEADIIDAWVLEHAPKAEDPIETFRIPPSRRRRSFLTVDPLIEERLRREEDDPLLIPIRVVWLARKRDGVRRVTFKDAFRIGDPRDPRKLQQRIILARHPDRCRIIMGAPARLSEVEQGWTATDARGPADGTTFGEFVALQSWLALERAERHLRGQRYKVSKFLRETLFWSHPFQRGVNHLAESEGKTAKRMQLRTSRYLKEIAAKPTPYVIDMVNAITSAMIATAHQSIVYSREELRAVYALGEAEPLVFLPSHKSNFDHLVLQHVLFENELPVNHTAGGMNMNFLLIGPLFRRTGVFFIRRQFKDNEPYKFVLRQYLDYLLEKRFAIEWYIEGGRSRTGKLREPRLGLLKYVVDSYQRGIVNDVILVPVSINYDQITDVSSYAAEQRGRAKEKESLRWVVKFLTGLRRKHGSIHLRFGEPLAISTRVSQDEDLDSDEGRLVLPKIAFEVSTRINDVTPITVISLVTMALLSGESQGFTVDETLEILHPFLDFVQERDLPTTFERSELTTEIITSALNSLSDNKVIQQVDGLTETVYAIGPEQHLAAAYYRNSVIHFFVNAGIVELAIASGLLTDSAMDEDAIVERAVELRDLLKFEFFFAGRDEFESEIRTEIERYRVDHGGPNSPVAVDVDAMRPAKSPIVLRPFLEAYFVVSSALESFGDEPVTADELAAASLAMGEQLVAQGDILSPEALSTSLFSSGVKVADNRGLLDSAIGPRTVFRQEVESDLAALASVAALQSAT